MKIALADLDPDPSLARPLRLVLITIVVTMAAALAVNFLAGRTRSAVPSLVMLAATALAWGIARRGHFRAAAVALFYSLALGVTALLWVGNGVRDHAMAGYPAVLFAGCVFLGPAAYWGLTALVLAGLGATGAAELTGFLASPFSDHNDLRGLINLCLIMGGSAVSGRVLMVTIRAAAARERALSGALRDSEATAQKIFHSSQSTIAVSRLSDGTYLDVNDSCLAMFGFTRGELIGRTSVELGIWDNVRDRARLVQEVRDRKLVRGFETRLRKKSGEVMEAVLAAELFESGGEPYMVISASDVTAVRAAERRAEFLSTRDALTGLPNRVLALDRLQRGIERAKREGSRIALLDVDLDRFGTINESFGYAFGDALLREAGARISATLRGGDTLARVGADEFLIIVWMRDGEEDEQVAGRILGVFERPFEVEGRTVRLATSTGVAVFPADAADAETLLHHAEAAMHFSEAEGRGRSCRFHGAIGEGVRDRLFVESSLRQSLRRRELHLVYQPRFDLRTRALSGLEALCRWTHPELGDVPPARFIAIAEESDLIHEVGLFVLRESCEQIATWRRRGIPSVPIAVNLSARQLNPALPGIVADCVQAAGVNPGDVELEVTESMLITSPEATRKVLQQVASGGSRIVLDDFGIGYSSLNYIKHLPLDGLKIDRSFVREIAESRHDSAIVTAIVTLAHGLGLRVAAEGIESPAQLETMAGLGCDEGQGFFLSRPLENEEVTARFFKM
jgi:diguanylate cyclase (GGDEF)-like protein/PAS domain S-box-containing protein